MTEEIVYNGQTYASMDEAFHAACETVRAKDDLPEKKSVRPPDFSDAGNANVFVREYKDDLIFVDALGWLWWNGQNWERDDHQALGMGIDLSARMWLEAAMENKEAKRQEAEAIAKCDETGADQDKSALTAIRENVVKPAKAFLAHAKKTRGEVQIRHMLTLAKPALVLKADQLDANPYDLNTPAGIVDLRTGAIRTHDRKAYCTQITSCAPGPQGKEKLDDFLDWVTCHDRDLEGYLQRVFGMAAIGEVLEEILVILNGGGKNGKTTFTNSMQLVMGTYAITFDASVLTTSRNTNKGATLATLRGKRLAIAGELEENQRLSGSFLKRVASTDMMTIEEKYKQPETIKPTHTPIMFTNFLPRIFSRDNGTWRRLAIVPFNAVVSKGSDIKNYGEVLFREAGPAAMAWIIEGAVDFIRRGCRLDPPAAVLDAVEQYRHQEDWLEHFIEDRCEKGPNFRERSSMLYAAYKDWCQVNNEFCLSKNDFSPAVERAGYQKKILSGRQTFYGLRLSDPNAETSRSSKEMYFDRDGLGVIPGDTEPELLP